ncbi:MAG: hypothetical protein M0Z94_00865, partial [Dehalococcoidales bacterium]|nr:hypothetical protein [Dehalococcoidales bacterium]
MVAAFNQPLGGGANGSACPISQVITRLATAPPAITAIHSLYSLSHVLILIAVIRPYTGGGWLGRGGN